MKIRILLYLLIGSLPLFGEFPDLTKAFPNGKLVSVTEIDPFNKIMSFGSDDSFDSLKKQLLKTLGEGWIEIETTEETEDQTAINAPPSEAPPKLNVAGDVYLKNDEFPDVKVRLTVFATTVFKTKNSLLLAIERKKVQKKG